MGQPLAIRPRKMPKFEMEVIPSQGTLLKLPFRLPVLEMELQSPCCTPFHGDFIMDHAKDFHDIDTRLIAYAIQKQCDPKIIKRYIQAYPESVVREALLKPIQRPVGQPGLPILFYAVEQHSPELVRILCEAGADPGQRAQPSGIPLLTYTIISAEYKIVDMTDTLVALLAMGANSADVPIELWDNYLEAPSRQVGKIVVSIWDHFWCTRELLDALCRNLTLMQRYVLNKAKTVGKPTPRMLQVARAFDFLPLFETPYHLIGQNRSTQHILRSIVSHYLYDAEKPLVLLFTGMSGHGKTEFAKRIGNLLSLAFHRVDMTEMRFETDIFGPKKPYQGHEKGAVMNNFLAEHTGQRCVIFLDEFEKTTQDVRQSMLLLLESGFYKDRRNDKALDCTKIIWILAANFGEATIQKFWTEHMKDQSIAKQSKAPFDTLQRQLETQLTGAIGAPMTGRLSSIVPFFPFEEGEQAVATYKFMRELWHVVRGPIDVAAKKFARHSHLNFVNDSAIALHLARKHYTPQLGARSLEKAVNHDIRAQLAYKQMEDPEEFKDSMNDRPLPNFEVRLVTSKEKDDAEVVEVVQVGNREVLLFKDEMKEEEL